MRNGLSYKQNSIEGEYDYILIGSGIGCLSCAAVLSRNNMRCLVLEKHYTAGGYTHVFTRKGYEWDVGVHYIGDVNRPTTLLYKLFDYISQSRLKWQDMGDVYDKIFLGEEEFRFVKGTQNFKDELKKSFPSEEDSKAIDQYIDLIYKANSTARGFFAEKALPDIVARFIGKYVRKDFMAFASRTTLDVLQGLTTNKKLIAVLTGQYGDYGLPPSESSFAMHASLVKHYLKGAAYPIGGSAQICASILPTIRQSGGEVYTNAGVENILFEGKKAIGVKMEDGKEYFAPKIISGAGWYNTNKLIPENIAGKLNWKQNEKKVNRSASHVSLYIGLEGTTEELELGKANYWIYPDDYDHDLTLSKFLQNPEENFPVIYISFPSAKDPEWDKRYPGKSTIEIITIAPYKWFNKWEDTRWKKRGDDYEALKEQFAHRMLKYLYDKEPQVKGKIDFYELSTPLSTRHFANYDEGEIYGLSHDPKRFQQRFLKPKTPFKNLFLTGQDIATAGVGGALVAGALTASTLLKKNMIKEIAMLK